MADGFAAADKSKPFIANNSLAKDRGYRDDSQQQPPVEGPGLINTFVCNCTDCRKLTASMFASNFAIDDKYLVHVRGRDNLKSWYNPVTPVRHEGSMTDYFCSTCGTLMYRVSSAFPNVPILRIGSVDDLSLHETKLKPQWEQFTKDRVSWFGGVNGGDVRQIEGNSTTYTLSGG